MQRDRSACEWARISNRIHRGPRREKKKRMNVNSSTWCSTECGRTFFSPSFPPPPLWKTNRDLRSPPTQSRCYTRRPATIFERCLSGLDQIYSYEFQKALDSSPKRSLLADVPAPRNDAPKIRVLAVELLVDAFVRLLRYPRRRAREPGIAMAPIHSRQKVCLFKKNLKIWTIFFSFPGKILQVRTSQKMYTLKENY